MLDVVVVAGGAPQAAADIFGRRDAVVAGSGVPAGTAERVEGGYRVSGTWRYASGARYATTFTANCIVHEAGAPVLDGGRPRIRAMAFRPEDVRLSDSWDTSGMRATGSLDFTVEGAFVPEARSFSVADAPREPGPLYRVPVGVVSELTVVAVAVGLGQRLAAEFARMAAARRVPATATLVSGDPASQEAYAHARAAATIAEAALHDQATAIWAALSRGDIPGPQSLAVCSAVSVRIAMDLRQAAEELAALVGMQAIARDNAFARARRDMAALACHFAVAPRKLVGAGEALLQSAAA